MKYLFELGNHPELSRAEITHVFLAQGIPYSAKATIPYFFVETNSLLSSQNIMNLLGGTKKIAREITPTTSIEDIANYLEEVQPTGKMQFSISPTHKKKIALAVKKELKTRGRSVRYIEPKNTATILHNSLIQKKGDLTIVQDACYVTEAIQPIEELGKRDFERPGRDDVSGMLPPKLAKILINLGGKDTKVSLLDPFCGSGTILMEARLMGYHHLTGTDLSQKAIADTKKNLQWIEEQFDIPNRDTTLEIHDVRKIGTAFQKETFDFIVSEPYMGTPVRTSTKKETQQKEIQQLKQLYLDAFRSFKNLLSKDGVIVIIIPKFYIEKKWLSIDCVKDICQIGFTVIPFSHTSQSLLYHRQGQFVGREIWKFKKAV